MTVPVTVIVPETAALTDAPLLMVTVPETTAETLTPAETTTEPAILTTWPVAVVVGTAVV